MSNKKPYIVEYKRRSEGLMGALGLWHTGYVFVYATSVEKAKEKGERCIPRSLVSPYRVTAVGKVREGGEMADKTIIE